MAQLTLTRAAGAPNTPPETGSASTNGAEGDRGDTSGSNVVAMRRAAGVGGSRRL